MVSEIEKIILEAACSKSLLYAIDEKGLKFQDFDLLIFAYRYSLTYDKQIELLRLISENTKDERTKMQAEKCTKYKENEYAKFISDEKDCVFEVIVTEYDTEYEDRFLAKTYKVAIDKMKNFSQHYKKNKFKFLQIEILKRKINDKIKDEDRLGRAGYNENLELVDIDYYKFDDEKKWLCPECNCYYNDDKTVDNKCFLHREVELPKFIHDMDLITYKPYHDTLGNSKYAINIDWDDDDGSETFKTASSLCIPLDVKFSDMKTINDLLDEHTHVDYVHIDRIEPNELPKKTQKTYHTVMKVLLKEGKVQ